MLVIDGRAQTVAPRQRWEVVTPGAMNKSALRWRRAEGHAAPSFNDRSASAQYRSPRLRQNFNIVASEDGRSASACAVVEHTPP